MLRKTGGASIAGYVIASLLYCATAQVGSLCRPNERFLECGGCQKTCTDPAPNCVAVCRTGCYCEEGMVRNATSECVKLEDCPPVCPDEVHLTEPRAVGLECPENEEYRSCEPCNRTCSNPKPICPAQCERGCFCKKNLVRNEQGICVKYEECPEYSTNYDAKPMLLSTQQNNNMTCGPFQEFKQCGTCEKTCVRPQPLLCPAQCITGCFCVDGYVRDPKGNCVKLEDCPKVLEDNQTLEYKADTPECSEQEEYRFCEPCNRTCSNPQPICPEHCTRGCFCKEDLVRNQLGACVKYEECPEYGIHNDTIPKKPNKGVPYNMTCGPLQVYKQCETCERTCTNPEPSHCGAQCTSGCFCEEGYVKHSYGNCFKLEDCPKADISGPSQIVDTSIEECSPDEEYLQCGWCEPTCSAPRPHCPPGSCTRGCLCKPPLVRHRTGNCVPLEHCSPMKCAHPNEEFKCRYGCERYCDRRPCLTRARRRCSMGCYCKFGYRRNPTGFCVLPEHCGYASSLLPSTESEVPTTLLP